MSGSHRSIPAIVVLHGLRCAGHGSPGRLATVVGLPESTVRVELERLLGQGLVTSDPGPFGGWGITESGRREDARQIAAELELTGARSVVSDALEVFLGLNQRLLDVCGDWQMVRLGDRHVANDHTDLGRDAGILERLVAVDDAVQPVVATLSARLGRFGAYGRRLGSALELSLAGHHRHVAEDMDSYHHVWFQLHEDLLTTLGRERWG